MKTLSVVLALMGSVCFADISGEWDVVGKGDNGNKWVAQLVLNVDTNKRRDKPEEKEMSWLPPENYTGYFIWQGENGTGGKEYVYAHVDYANKEVRLTGHTLENADRNIIQALYVAKLSEDKNRMNEGKWDGQAVIPGRWKAKRKGVEQK